MRRVRYIEVRPGQRNVFAQIASLIIGIGVLVLSVILGAFFLAAFLGFAILVAVAVYARFWWLRRRFEQARRDEFIEGEYRVVDAPKSRDREP